MKKIRTIDLFAGIGGIRLGFEKAFGEDNIETVFVSEWDKYAQTTYAANFKDNFAIAGDITKVDEKDIPEFDICLAGFPCQAFSLAGQRMGFEDNYKGTCRGTLFMDVARICEYHKPKVIFCENVKGLVIHDKGRTFDIIRKTFEELGYKVFYQVLNSKNYGVPQNRERIYIVAFRNDIAPKNFQFPEPTDKTKRIWNILEDAPVDAKYYLSDVYYETLKKHKARHAAKGNGFGFEIRYIDQISGAIVCGGMGRERNLIKDDRQEKLVPTTHIKGDINSDFVRKMTPREWARLQGFPDTFALPLADTHLYKQLGNSVTVPVIEAIAKKIMEVLIPKSDLQNDGISQDINGIASPTLSGNKGEWSEIYVFLRLLHLGKLYAADEDLNKLDGVFYNIIDIIRKENIGSLEFNINQNNRISVIRVDNGEVLGEFDVSDFRVAADKLYMEIISAKTSTFTSANTEAFLNELNITTIKARSNDKSDIRIKIHDINSGIEAVQGFSIKSRLGEASTLINAGKTTNFIYEICGAINDALMYEFNTCSNQIKKRLEVLKKADCSINYCEMENKSFEGNLLMLDGDLPAICAKMLHLYYAEGIRDVSKSLEKMSSMNPMGYNLTLGHPFYQYKFKKLLSECALGMTPAKTWNGIADATGGYIIVREDGEVLCYHLFNRNEFENYLMKNTKFETASTSRHQFGSIYKENGKYYLKLNMQIRFIK